MPFDILIFAGIAAFLVYRLMTILGTRHGDERKRPNPFERDEKSDVTDRAEQVSMSSIDKTVMPMAPVSYDASNIHALDHIEDHVDKLADKDGRVTSGLQDIVVSDPSFDLDMFIAGAQYAFEMVVVAYNKGDRDTLRPLLSPKLYKDFEQGIIAREAKGHTAEVIIHRIKEARITEAHLGGTMAYITVDFDVEETLTTRDAEGTVVDGDPNMIFSIKDIWTLTRDIRSRDPNWTIIETRTAEE